MKIGFTVLVIGSGLAFAVAPALAQGRPVELPKPPTHAQTGTAVAPSTTATPRPRAAQDRHGDGSADRRANRTLVRLPAEVGADGRVFTNFGNGPVLVSSQCASRQTGAHSATGPAYGQPEITQPVPQPILQPVPGAGQQPNSVAPTANSACWTRDANGVVEVFSYR